MSHTITLTFDGKNELLLRAIEAYEQSEMFEDEEGNAVKLSREEIALNMLMEGCMQWVQDVPGLPEELEDEILETFEVCDDDCECEDHCEDDDGDGHAHHRDN